MELQNNFPEGYNGPKKSWWDFTKINPWVNNIRILDWRVVVWYEYFDTDKKPVRQKTMFLTTPNIWEWFNWKPQYPKEIWAMKVYNYETKQVEQWNVSQSSIKDFLWTTSKNEKLWWLWALHLEITKTWEKLETKYTILPIKTDIEDEVKKASEESEIDLDKYFEQNKVETEWFPTEAFPETALVSE